MCVEDYYCDKFQVIRIGLCQFQFSFYRSNIHIVTITHLFKLIVQCGIVPTDFGCGVIILLVKNSDGDMTSSENYRGITLSPVISKLFE